MTDAHQRQFRGVIEDPAVLELPRKLRISLIPVCAAALYFLGCNARET